MKRYMVFFTLWIAITICIIPTSAKNIDRIEIQTEQDVLFLGMDAKVSAYAYADGEPLETEIRWAVEAGGKVENGVFSPAETGKIMLTASAGNVSAQAEITVLSHPTALRVEPSRVSLAVNEEKELMFYGYAENGAFAPIPHRFIDTFDEEIECKDGKIRLLSGKGRMVDFFFRGTETVLALDVKTAERQYVKLQNGSFYGFPETVTGSVKKTTQDITLSYAFSEETHEEQTAYLVFSQSIFIADDKKKVYITVESDAFYDVVLRAMLVDAQGKTFRPVLCEPMPKGKKECSFYIPDEAVRPVKLTRLSVETLSNKDMEGEISFSSFAVEPDGEISYCETPVLVMPDPLYQVAKAPVFAFLPKAKTMLGLLAKNKVEKDTGITIADDEGFYIQKEAGVLLIHGGEEKISETNKQTMLSQIEASKTAIVLWMQSGVLSEAEEAVIFAALQKASERVSVIYITDGLVYDAVQKGAVRYITLATHESPNAAQMYAQMRYLSIGIEEDGKLSYDFKKVRE